MREIKFKYIYGIKGKPETYFSKVFTLDQIEQGYAFEELSDNPLMGDYRNLYRLSCAGIPDKNGVEIYEGDIVTCYPTSEIAYTKTVKWAKDRPTLGITVDSSGLTLCEGGCDEIEIIGNIYEDKELLD